MKTLVDCKDNIHSCSKCGLCQSVCPIYKITGNDCTVSRGQFIMLRGLINGELKMSKTINKYLDLCLKCGACTKFCPSGIDVVDIVALAKAEYFKTSRFEKLVSLFQKKIIFGAIMKFFGSFKKKYKSKKFDKKVIYFGGCGGNINHKTSDYVIKIMNSCGIEVITPNFDCCGLPFFVRGDMENFESYIDSFYTELEKYDTDEIVTTCASCEKTIKSYPKWKNEKNYTVKNIFEYIRENNLTPELNKKTKVTFHKPCNISNYEDIKYILENTKNLEYIEMEDYDKCCGLNGITKLSEYQIMLELYKDKHNKIVKSGAKTILTTCLGCQAVLSAFSFGKYKVGDLTEFLGKNIKTLS